MQNATASVPFENPGLGAAPLGDELARSLTLVRASTMNILRLQLALDRQDRRTILQTVDELVAIDGELRDFVSMLPSGSESEIERLQQQLESQRSALAREKLQLVGGVSMRRLSSDAAVSAGIDPGPQVAPEPPQLLLVDPIPDEEMPEPSVEADRRGHSVPIAIMAALILGFAALLLVYATGAGEDVLTALVRQTGG